MKAPSSHLLPTITFLLAGTIGFSHADISVLHHWRLGEDDTDDTATVDAVGDLDLPLTGVSASVASSVPISSLARDFTNVAGPWPTTATSFASTGTDSAITLVDPTNWGFECWINLDALPGDGVDSEVTFVHIGDHGRGSAILQLISGNYQIHLPGRALADSGIAASGDIGTWVHLALVNEMQYDTDDSVDPPLLTPTTPLARLFRNGVEIATTATAFEGGNGAVSVGTQFLNGTGGVQYARGPDGQIDDVRVFEFALGAFDPATDLLYPDGPGGKQPVAITDFKVEANGDFTLTWDSNPGESYAVWETTDLKLWLENRDAIGSGGAQTTITLPPLFTNADDLFVRVERRDN